MKKFILNIIIFSLIFWLSEKAFYILLKQNRPLDYAIFLESKKAFFDKPSSHEILIIGDSHIADALDPRTIKSNWSTEAFNLGIYHSSPYEQYHILKSALLNSKIKPKLVVYGTNPIMFERPKSQGKYTPLILENNFELIQNSNEGFGFGYFFHSAREKYLIKATLNKIKGAEYTPTRNVINTYNGHLMFYNQTDISNWVLEPTTDYLSFSGEQVSYFKKSLELLKEYKIKPVIVHSPILKQVDYKLKNTRSYELFDSTICSLVDEYRIPVFSDTASYQNDKFLNPQHLNYHGSTLFTNKFTDYIERFGF